MQITSEKTPQPRCKNPATKHVRSTSMFFALNRLSSHVSFPYLSFASYCSAPGANGKLRSDCSLFWGNPKSMGRIASHEPQTPCRRALFTGRGLVYTGAGGRSESVGAVFVRGGQPDFAFWRVRPLVRTQRV